MPSVFARQRFRSGRSGVYKKSASRCGDASSRSRAASACHRKAADLPLVAARQGFVRIEAPQFATGNQHSPGMQNIAASSIACLLADFYEVCPMHLFTPFIFLPALVLLFAFAERGTGSTQRFRPALALCVGWDRGGNAGGDCLRHLPTPVRVR